MSSRLCTACLSHKSQCLHHSVVFVLFVGARMCACMCAFVCVRACVGVPPFLLYTVRTRSVHWNYCVLDEGHIIKSNKTKVEII